MIDVGLSVTEYVKKTAGTVDGIAWLLVCIFSVLGVIDLYFDFGLLPLRNAAKPAKAIVLLVSSPLLIFLVMVRLRQIEDSRSPWTAWLRGCVCVAVFLVINFKKS